MATDKFYPEGANSEEASPLKVSNLGWQTPTLKNMKQHHAKGSGTDAGGSTWVPRGKLRDSDLESIGNETAGCEVYSIGSHDSTKEEEVR